VAALVTRGIKPIPGSFVVIVDESKAFPADVGILFIVADPPRQTWADRVIIHLQLTVRDGTPTGVAVVRATGRTVAPPGDRKRPGNLDGP
jgi:hypothetical protein